MANASTQFGGFLTNVGVVKQTNANALQLPWKITRMQLGDAGGEPALFPDPTPSPTQTALINVVHDAPLNALYPSPTDPGVLIAELVLPPNVGGWWIRETALRDEDGDLIAVAKPAPSYKPLLVQNTGRTQTIRMHVVFGNTANIQLKVDPAVVLATRAQLEAADAEARAFAAGLMTAHQEAADPHQQYMLRGNVLPRGYIAGLAMSNNAVAHTTDIDIAPGCARDAADACDLALRSALTKRLQESGSWVAGSSGNGLFSGAKAQNTWYHLFLIRRDSDGAVDAGFDTSVDAENRPADYGAYLRIGSVKTDASGHIVPFLKVGRRTYWDRLAIDVSVTLTSGAAGTYALTVPPGVRSIAMVQYAVQGPNAIAYIRCPDIASVAPTSETYAGYGATSNANPEGGAGYVEVPTNLAGEISAVANVGSSIALTLNTLGWIDL